MNRFCFFMFFVLVVSFVVPFQSFSSDFRLGPAPQLTKEDILQRTDYGLRQVPGEDSITGVPEVDTSDPAAVAAFYEDYFLSGLAFDLDWTGSIVGCLAGTISQENKEATIRAVNFFRAMTGLPGNVTLDEDLSVKCQDSALMMIAQANLSHFPPENWACYTADGAEAAGKSNIAVGSYGPSTIRGYMQDPGPGNEVVGHRRWILYPPQVTMGTGDTDVRNKNFPGSNTLWVIGNFGARPETPEWVAWPSQGYVPYQLVFTRWSFTKQNADFTNTSVNVTRDGEPVNLTIMPIRNGFGDNTLVWEIDGFPASAPSQPVTYSVELMDVLVNGAPESYSYDVIMYNHQDFLGISTVEDWMTF